MSPLLPPEELARLEALARYSVLDDLPAEAFARLATLAAQFFRVPMALVNFVTEDAARCQAGIGVDLRTVDRSVSFCTYTLGQLEVLAVPDLTRDARFLDNPLVTAPGGYRFYAGAPLTTPSGHNIGTLCVLDTEPREAVTPAEREALRNLAALAVDELELRRVAAELEREARDRDRLMHDLRRVTRHSETLLAISELADLDLLPHELAEHAVRLLAEVADLDWAGLVLLDGPAEPRPLWQTPGLPFSLTGCLTRPWPWATALGSETARFWNTGADLARWRPDLAGAGACVAAQIALGTSGEQALSLLAVRTRPLPWTAAERALRHDRNAPPRRTECRPARSEFRRPHGLAGTPRLRARPGGAGSRGAAVRAGALRVHELWGSQRGAGPCGGRRPARAVRGDIGFWSLRRRPGLPPRRGAVRSAALGFPGRRPGCRRRSSPRGPRPRSGGCQRRRI
nr:GAF domain-containing protein [Deinococcus murrayi]